MPDDHIISDRHSTKQRPGWASPARDAHMDELYSQLQGVLAGTASLRNIDVTDTEPDMAFSRAARVPKN